jgi:hypothetical protein
MTFIHALTTEMKEGRQDLLSPVANRVYHCQLLIIVSRRKREKREKRGKPYSTSDHVAQ